MTNSKPKRIYVAHPISGDIDANLKDLARILRVLNLKYPDMRFYAPYYADIIALDDNNPEERARGIANDTELILSCAFDEIWLTGSRVSFGMGEESKLFTIMGKPIVNKINEF